MRGTPTQPGTPIRRRQSQTSTIQRALPDAHSREVQGSGTFQRSPASAAFMKPGSHKRRGQQKLRTEFSNSATTPNAKPFVGRSTQITPTYSPPLPRMGCRVFPALISINSSSTATTPVCFAKAHPQREDTFDNALWLFNATQDSGIELTPINMRVQITAGWHLLHEGPAITFFDVDPAFS